MPYLQYISDQKLIEAVSKVISAIEEASQDTEHLHKNVVDPFSAFFDGVAHNITYDNWLKQEKARQAQKTMQNAIGDFHQEILGSIDGWKNLGPGGGLDVINEKLKIIAEIKNKFNTTKGNHKVKLYDSIKFQLKKPAFQDYTGYYVEIIPYGKKQYNVPFTPPDSSSKKRRPKNNKIRVIDGLSFYKLVSGKELALKELFEVLPAVVADHFKYKLAKDEAIKYFELFKLAFPV